MIVEPNGKDAGSLRGDRTDRRLERRRSITFSGYPIDSPVGEAVSSLARVG